MPENIAEKERYSQLQERLKIIDDQINSAHHHHEGDAARNLERERKQILEEIEKFGASAKK